MSSAIGRLVLARLDRFDRPIGARRRLRRQQAKDVGLYPVAGEFLVLSGPIRLGGFRCRSWSVGSPGCVDEARPAGLLAAGRRPKLYLADPLGSGPDAMTV
jgi:hypothetical protein